jgi:hypothetical protein
VETKPNRPHQVKVLLTAEELKSLDASVQQTGTNRAEVLRTLLLQSSNASATQTPAQSMNINADYAGCNLEEFLTLTYEELQTLESLVSEQLCRDLDDDEAQSLDVLHAKLIMRRRITH